MIRNGVDIVDVARLERELQRWPRLEARLFTEAERSYASARPRRAEHLAARFAAKEAAFKALGVGWPSLTYDEVEVTSGRAGPRLAFRGRAAALVGDRSASVSLSHDGGFAIAQVILVGDEDDSQR